MKRLFLLLMLFTCITLNGQVTIENKLPEKEVKVTTGNCYVYRDTKTNEYFLVVLSSHENERNLFEIQIKLGNNKNEAIESIKQIEEMYESANDEEEFTISGHDCFVDKGVVFGKIQFPRHKYENSIFQPIFCIRAFLGRLNLYVLAMREFENGNF